MFTNNYYAFTAEAVNKNVSRQMTREEFKSQVRMWRSASNVSKNAMSTNAKNMAVVHASSLYIYFCPLWLFSVLNGAMVERTKVLGVHDAVKTVQERFDALKHKKEMRRMIVTIRHANGLIRNFNDVA